MKLKRISPVTGETNEMELYITEEQLAAYYASNRMIQDFFPNLTADEREFILTGCTKEDWEAIFKEEEDDE